MQQIVVNLLNNAIKVRSQSHNNVDLCGARKRHFVLLMIVAEPVFVRFCVYIVVDNLLQFTPENGTVTLWFETTPIKAKANEPAGDAQDDEKSALSIKELVHLKISVQDTGIGMTQVSINKFERLRSRCSRCPHSACYWHWCWC